MSQTIARVFKHSQFIPNPFGHGGNKRTAQINWLLNEAGITFTDSNFVFSKSIAGTILSAIKGYYYKPKLKIGWRKRLLIGRYIETFERFIKQNRPDYFIWESTVDYNLLLADVLDRKKVPFITIPHNIEAFIDDSHSLITDNAGSKWVEEELSYLNLGQHTFCISLDETEALKQNNIPACYLPYHPPPELSAFLLKIRSRRLIKSGRKSSIKKILLLGTFYNPPTAKGYEHLLTELVAIKNIFIDVAGFGSESLQGVYPNDIVKIWGSIDKELLQELIIAADVALVHQIQAAGALTRIPELLTAGLPVIANTIAARSTGHLSGITVYHDTRELSILLAVDANFDTPKIPDRPVQETFFENYIQAHL